MCTWLFKSSPWFNSIQFNFISTSTEMQGIYSNHKTHKSNNNRWLRDDNRRKLLKACGMCIKAHPTIPKAHPMICLQSQWKHHFWEFKVGTHVMHLGNSSRPACSIDHAYVLFRREMNKALISRSQCLRIFKESLNRHSSPIYYTYQGEPNLAFICHLQCCCTVEFFSDLGRNYS